ncbi:extracellular solute-binding protein [Paenibacillus nuruki]|uniref:extracellular solute-binding protein n=1 Tax=Paenibacillus nuruki TaxID=1886670 RepID=UPI0028042423|nr:extracellular solute-binding protein [Paenibacillus nuruki]CAJ1311696.1 Extracellular solute-binding protein [Paenibacillus nuruki]
MRSNRLIGITLGSLCLMLLLSACTSSAVAPAPVGTTEQQAVIQFVAAEYSSSTKPLLEKLVRNFMRENPSITVELQVVNWDLIDGVYTSMISEGHPPDLLNMNMYARFGHDDLLNNMDDLISDDLKNKLSPHLSKLDRIQGKQYAIPYVATIRKLYYEQNLFQQAGITRSPQTWSQLTQDAIKLKAIGAYGFGVDLTDNEIPAYLSYFFFGAGGGWMKNGKWDINSPQNVAGLTYLKQLYTQGLTDPEPTVTIRDEKQRILGDGQLGMMISGNYFASVTEREFPNTAWGNGAIPVKDGQPPMNFGVQDVMLSFKTDHTNREALSTFLDYLYNDENYEEMIRQEGMIPVTTTVASKLSLEDPIMEADIQRLESAYFYPLQQPEWGDIMALTRKMGNAILYNGVTPQAALNQVQQYAERQQTLYQIPTQ